jgi:hypothetical protein
MWCRQCGDNRGDLGMRLGCMVRVESIRQDPMMSHWMSLAGGCDQGIPYERYLWWVHVMRRSRGGVSLWDEAPGWRCH